MRAGRAGRSLEPNVGGAAEFSRRRKPASRWSSRSGGHPLRAARTIRQKSSSSLLEVRPFDDCVSGRAVDLLDREVVADHIFDADQAIDGQPISKELPASATVLRSVGSTVALGIGTFGQIVAVLVALARKSVCGDDLFERFCGRHVDSARRSFPLRGQRLDEAGSAPEGSPVNISVHREFSREHRVLSLKADTALSPASLARRRFYPFGTRAGVNRRLSGTPSVTKVGSIGWISLAGLCSVADREAVANDANNLSGGRQSESSAAASEVHWRCDAHLDAALLDYVPHHAAAVAGRTARCPSGHDTKDWVAFSWRIAIAYPSKRVGGVWCIDVIFGRHALIARNCCGSVWMDHICCRPAAASAFRLTLKDGAEPSLGAPGPE